MSDIVTRLLLKTNDFDANLNKSKGNVNNFQSGITDMSKTAGAGVMKFAGAIGLAVGVTESFGKIIGSQQSTQDAWDNNIFAAKLTVDKFFTSINNGDWTSFQNGFMQSLVAAKNLSAEIDALNDKRLSLTYIKSESLSKIEENKAVATDTTQPIEVRRKAFAEMQKERAELEKKTNETIKKETDVLIKTLNVQYGDLRWNEEDIMTFVVDTNFSGGSSEFLSYKKQLDELKSKEKKTTYNAGGVTGGSSTLTIDKAAVEKTKQFKLQNQALEKQRVLEQEADGKRTKTVNLLRQQAIERRELSALAKAENRISKQMNGGGGGGGNTPKEEPKNDSLAWYDSQISAQNKKLIEETDMQARGAIQATIDELEQKKINLKFVVDQEAFKIAHGAMKDGALPMPIKPVYDKLPTRGKGGKDFKLPKYEPSFDKKDVRLNQDYAESLSTIGGIMGSLSGLTNESAAAYLQWGANVISSIAQAIPAIMSLTTAKTAEAAANSANSAAQIPFVGWLAAAGAAISVVAAMASIPKFANGGIVPGASFTGDKVPALLNSGEMILNGSQQGNLFKALNSGVVGSLSDKIAPSSNNATSSNVTFRIHGRDLEGVLANFHNQKKKVR